MTPAARPDRANRTIRRVSPVGPTRAGTASWYGPGFDGRTTASGEQYDMHGLTAAHRTLPFGTRLRVCHADRCVVVRINDRGPFVQSRLLDLSRGAAARIGLLGSGVGRVTATAVAVRRVDASQRDPRALAPAPGAHPVSGIGAVPVSSARPALPPYAGLDTGVVVAGCLAGAAGSALVSRRLRTR